MATNLDAMPYLGGASATPSQVARVKEIPLSAPWAQPPDRPSGIGDRCRAAMFGVYLRYKNIPEETARHIFQKHEGGCAAAWLRVDAHDRTMSEAAKLARPSLRERCLAAMFGLYLRCKGITENTAREIFKGHVGSRRACVLAWFKVHGRSSDGDVGIGRHAPAAFCRMAEASDQTRRDAVNAERFAAKALKEALPDELPPLWSDWSSQPHEDAARVAILDVASPQPTLPQAAEISQELDWRERFARACAGAAWDDGEVRALMGLQPDEELPGASEQAKLREEITALAQKAGLRAGAPLSTDPVRLAVQVVAGEVGIHPAFQMHPLRPNVSSVEGSSERDRNHSGGVSGLAALGGSEASPWRLPGAIDSPGRIPQFADASAAQHKPASETSAKSLDRRWRGEI